MLLAFIAGTAMRSFIPVPVAGLWIIFVGAMTAVVLGAASGRTHLWMYALLCLAAIGGIIRMHSAIGSEPNLAEWYGKNVLLRGVIAEEPEESPKAQRISVKIESSDQGARSGHFLVLATVRPYPKYALGDEITLEGTLEQPENFSDFDYIAYLGRRGIFAVIAFPKIEKIAEGKGNRLYIWLSRVKHSFENRIDAILPDPHAAFLKGLLLGEREALPQDLVRNFQKTGTSHIVALSGYNITLVGTQLMNFLLFLTVPFRWSGWIASAAIIGFVVMTGASASVVRAGVMGLLLLTAQRMGRMYHMTNALLFAGALMILHNPKILRFDAGFQLSFLATLGLVWCAPIVQGAYEKLRWRIMRSWRLWRQRASNDPAYRGGRITAIRLILPERIFIETLSAQVMVLPLLIYLFGRISLVSPLTNVLVLMAVPAAMGIGFLAGLASYAWEPLGRVAGWLAWLVLQYILSVIELFAEFPGASVALPAFSLALLVLLYTVIFLIIIRRSTRLGAEKTTDNTT